MADRKTFEWSAKRGEEALDLALSGRLDFHGSNLASEMIRSVVQSGARACHVHLDNVSFISSMGVGFLLILHHELVEIGVKMCLHNPSHHAARVFKTITLSRTIDIVEDIDHGDESAGREA